MAMTGTDQRQTLERELDALRPDLRAYCYRMLGSAFDAEDAVQDTLVRAWRHIDRFEGRSSLRSWLYRIATNVCLDVIAGRKRRALPADLAAPSRPDEPLGPELGEHVWLEPAADAWLQPGPSDPGERAVVRDSVRLAFVAALQVLPARQRAALILREVLAWRPSEIAELLDTTVVSVNSALQRARQTLAREDTGRRLAPVDAVSQELLDRYVDAFERFDIDALVSLLHEDATFDMPPLEFWLRGVDDIREWLLHRHCTIARYLPITLNGAPGFAMYRTTAEPGLLEAFGVQVLDVRDDVIVGIHNFLDARLVELFGGSATLVV